MKTFIALLLGCSLAVATGARAEQDQNKNKKSKPVQKQPVVQKQHTVPNAHVQTTTKQHYNNPTLQNNAKLHHNGPQFTTAPNVHSNHAPYVKPNHPVVQSNHVQVNKTVNVKNFQPKHQNFHAQVNSSVASVHFNQNYRIRNAQNWQGAHYNAFRTYHPQWHDRSWWHSHHNHIVLIGGGWYFWNAGYWYPAWGYDSSAAYYPYDGPIYVGDNPKPFDQIVADVQSVLQEQGYYHGEIDGLVGPLTQEALAAYQTNAGLEQTAAIDQPTLESLGVG